MTIKEVSEQFGISSDTLRYYERIGMIPSVTRTEGGIRDYHEKDINWVKLAKCMRESGLPIEVMIEYVSLYQIGDSTIEARYKLLSAQRDILLEQRKKIDDTIDKIDYKIAIYDEAMKTGVLSWD